MQKLITPVHLKNSFIILENVRSSWKENKEIGRPLYACVHTFGCQMNARDSEKLLGVLKEIGYLETEDEDKSDFVIYNTCTVREC